MKTVLAIAVAFLIAVGGFLLWSRGPIALYGQPANQTLGLVRVTRVVDGDTIQIQGGQKVRYIGIDTPETVDPRKPVQCFGKEASRKNKELVEEKFVRLEKDVSEYDKYHRLLRYVYLNNTFVNLELVKQGYARAATFPPDVAHQQEFLAAEEEARREKRGLWNACPVEALQEFHQR